MQDVWKIDLQNSFRCPFMTVVYFERFDFSRFFIHASRISMEIKSEIDRLIYRLMIPSPDLHSGSWPGVRNTYSGELARNSKGGTIPTL